MTGIADLLHRVGIGAPAPASKPPRRRERMILIRRSPLSRRIILFNLVAMIVMAAGILSLNPFRDSLVYQRENAIVREMALIAQILEANIAPGDGKDGGKDAVTALQTLRLSEGATAWIFDTDGHLLGSATSQPTENAVPLNLPRASESTAITDMLGKLWDLIARNVPHHEPPRLDPQEMATALADQAREGHLRMASNRDASGATIFSVAQVLSKDGRIWGVVAMTTAAGEIDRLVRAEREQVLQVFFIALVVSIGLSLVLASIIANPIAELARAAEAGQETEGGRVVPSRVRIPDLTGRPDEIGQLSGAMRGMVDALYEQIDANEQFAADVAHEIKNPLASLRSAVASLQIVKKPEQRQTLMEIIDADVQRLDRLVSDISNASRLDSELVREEQEPFDMVPLLRNMCDYLGRKAREAGVTFVSDLPAGPIWVTGLENRLAQVFVNLITNALSFCHSGDSVRVTMTEHGNRVLVSVEDSGPGIPEGALAKVFERFYSQRPAGQFGDHSGLGLAISKQIVEAHGGTIHAENRSDDPGQTGAHGARFVVALPL